MKWSKTDDHTITSTCGKYRISKGPTAGVMVYHVWTTEPVECLFRSGTSAWRCTSTHRDPGGRDAAIARARSLADGRGS